MFCQKCGTQIDDNSKFCISCGATVEEEPTVQAQPQQPQYQQPQYQQPQYVYVQKPSIPGRGLGIAGMVLGIIGLVYGFYSIFMAASIVGSFRRIATGALAFTFIFLSVLSILGVSLAGAARNKGYRNGISTTGVVTGVIGLVLFFIAIIIVLAD